MKAALSRCCVAICLLALSACGGSSSDAAKAVAKPAKAEVRLTLVPQGALVPGKPVEVLAKLLDIPSRTVITADQLATVHTQKFHLLLLDPGFTDYQHIHPAPTDTPGLWRFTFTPKLAGGYRAWADITPLASGKQEYVIADLGAPRRSAWQKIASHEANVGSYRFTLTFDTPPQAGKESMGTLHITDKKGAPVAALAPVMGAYAHVVAFSEDFRTVLHTHPMGPEPKSAADRGGPDLIFHFEPQKPGFVKFFAQVNIAGKELFVPFSINVAP